MRTIAFSLTVCGAVLAPVLAANPAQAQSRTWVTGSGGSDANPCSRTAPCQTFAGAISKTAANGEINCIDSGAYGTVTITKSITIDCHDVFAGVLNSGVTGVTVNFDSFGADVRKSVRLRNLNFQGADTGLNGIRIIGGAASAGSEVYIDDVRIEGDFGGTMRGITDERSGGGKLFVTNTIIRNVGGSGIVVLPASGSTRIDVSLNRVSVQVAGNSGVAINNGAKAMIRNSVFSGNVNNGIDVEGAGAEATVSDSVSSNNGSSGVFVAGGAVVRLGNTDIGYNATGITGATSSFVNNRIAGNTAAGTAPTPIPPTPSNPSGQQ
jgi:hypothetical protein